MKEDDVLTFTAGFVTSLWSLELLLLLKSRPDHAWSQDQLVAELRGSETVVAETLADLRAARLVVASELGGWAYQPASGTLAAAMDDLERLYRIKPAAVIRTIASAPNRKLRILSDAFRIKE